MAYKYLILLCITSFSIKLSSQYYGQDILAGKKYVEIPFTYKQGFLLVDFNLQFILPIKLIFDTGAQNTVIFDKTITDRINVTYSNEIKIVGADLNHYIDAFIARNLFINQNNTNNSKKTIGVVRDLIVLKEDIVKLGEIVGSEIHGILGANYFKGLIVEINYIRSKIILHDPRYFNSKKYGKFEKTPLQVHNSKPYINAFPYVNNKEPDTLNFLLDTGAALSLLLQYNKSDSSKVLPQNIIEGSLGNGLTGPIMGHVGIIDSFKISNNINFNKPIAYFQNFIALDLDSLYVFRDGIIGNSLLSKFHLIIDYQNNVFYFKPNKNFKKEFVYDKSGLRVIATGKSLNKYIITNVLKGSPADLAGIETGDQIKKIGWRGNVFLSLQKISNLLSRKEGKEINLVILRNEKRIKKSFVLKNLFVSK